MKADIPPSGLETKDLESLGLKSGDFTPRYSPTKSSRRKTVEEIVHRAEPVLTMEHEEAEVSPLRRRNLNANNQQNLQINLSSQKAFNRADAEASLRGEDAAKQPSETKDEPKDFLRPKEALLNSLVDQDASQSSANLKDTAKEPLGDVITSEEEEITRERAGQPEGSTDLFYAEAVKTEVSYHHMIMTLLNI
jgi:hypothetical protein